MRCPECEGYISIEDWTDDTPFESVLRYFTKTGY